MKIHHVHAFKLAYFEEICLKGLQQTLNNSIKGQKLVAFYSYFMF